MNKTFKTAFMTTIATMVTLSAFAADYTKGVVTKLDTKAKKVTIKHEELKNLGMPGMTMVFKVKDDVVLGKLKAGAPVEFIADRVDGALTVVDVK